MLRMIGGSSAEAGWSRDAELEILRTWEDGFGHPLPQICMGIMERR